MAVALQPRHVTATSPVPEERRKKDTTWTPSSTQASNILANTDFAYQTKEIIHETFYGLLLEQGLKLNGGHVEPIFTSETNRKVYSSLMGACKQFLRLHSDQIRRDMEQLDISETALCVTFHSTMHSMFSDCINWGRIVALISFAVLVAYKAHKTSRHVVESIEGWLITFICQNLSQFIMKQKGWASVPDRFSSNKIGGDIVDAKNGGGSWLALAAVGVGAALVTAFLSK
ncbi:PREDICTED: bcl-2-like protein 1 [Amphimedon queenslandica]|uniref:Bcl-2 Bcl-2 homology region 1-3 domain-containing protein n=1 Tax=Amphimedon queenslandica TaxID=400682 RepID=A0A1X7U9C1_AMPQE|nr:PREDICTED: bcl-2-like protein 1 [Amphimedon queenslandica]|eukprot:XP_011405690.1 PREDICTED: bcl-2-like protein 1 [Amphimedon queenslandica]